MRGLLIACAGAFVCSACVRAARPPEVPVEIFAGEPVRIGADGLQWTYGDGTSGTSGTHAFARAGTFTTVSARGDEEAARFEVTVVPRPVLRAVPPEATAAIWIPEPKQSAGRMVDFCERAAAGFFTSSGAQRDPFLRYLLEVSAQPPSEDLSIDPAEGLAVFWLPGVPARIAAIGIDDEARAVRSAQRLFAADGFRAGAAGVSSAILVGPEGERIGVLADRGYLYLATFDPSADEEAPKALVERLRAAPSSGLGEVELLARLRPRVSEGGAFAWVRSQEQAGWKLRGVLASLSFSESRLELDAEISSDSPLWDSARAPEPSHELFDAADGAQVLIVASADPRGLGRLIDLVLALRPRRTNRQAELDRGGQGAPSTPGLDAAAGLRGDASFVANLDVARSLAQLSASEGVPELAADWTLLAGAQSQEGAGHFLEGLFEELFFVPRRRPSPGMLMYELDLDGRTASAGCCSKDGTLWFSSKRRGAKADPAVLRARFGEGAFSRGHLSLLLDVGALMRELEMPAATQADRAMQGFASTFLQQLTGIDSVFVDVVPDAEGGHARGVVELR